MTSNALRTQYVPIDKHWDSNDGIMRVEAIARSSGVLKYRTDQGDRFEYVPQEMIDLRDENNRPAMGWLGGAPLTNEHPPQVIRRDAETRKNYQVGKVSEEMHIYNDADGERVVKVRFDVSDPITQQQIRSGQKTGVSLGYLCKVDSASGEYKGIPYTHIQSAPFEIDHLAIVANPRNPGAVITRFDSVDSDDVGVAIGEAVALNHSRNAIELIHVDSGCSCQHSEDDEDEPITAKKKKKSTIPTTSGIARTDSNMIPVTFYNSTQLVELDTLNQLHSDGIIDRVQLDGRDYFVGADVALDLRNDGIIELDDGYHADGFVAKAGIAKGGGKCGRGWVGVKGSCKRLGKGADREGAQKAALKEFAAGQKMTRASKGKPMTAEKNLAAMKDQLNAVAARSPKPKAAKPKSKSMAKATPAMSDMDRARQKAQVTARVNKSKAERQAAAKPRSNDPYNPSGDLRSSAVMKAMDRRSRKTGSAVKGEIYKGSTAKGGDTSMNPRIQKQKAAAAEAAKTPAQRRKEAKQIKDFDKMVNSKPKRSASKRGKRSSLDDLLDF